MTKFKNHDVQSVNLEASTEKVFDFIANPANLPKWTVAFKQANENSGLLVTPNGALTIGLETRSNKAQGTIDWHMTMPDGSVGVVYSRVVEGPDKNAIYSFVLTVPPVSLEEMEGALSSQMNQLTEELERLHKIFKK